MKYLLLASAVFLVACPARKPSSDLIVGMDLSYPPFETIDQQGRPTGVSVDLAKALGDSLGREVRIENIPFTGLIPSLQNGRIDCVISSMTDTPERRQSISFSDPYLSTGLAILTGKASDISSSLDLDRPNVTVVVRQGTTGELWARGHLKEAKLISVEKENAAVLEVAQGKADAFLYDQMSVWQRSIKQPDSTRAILAPIQQEKWAVGVRKGNAELEGRINQFLKDFRAQGGFDRLGDKYFGQQKAAFLQANVPFVF